MKNNKIRFRGFCSSFEMIHFCFQTFPFKFIGIKTFDSYKLFILPKLNILTNEGWFSFWKIAFPDIIDEFLSFFLDVLRGLDLYDLADISKKPFFFDNRNRTFDRIGGEAVCLKIRGTGGVCELHT